MAGEVVRGIFVVLLWVGMWGVLEMIIDKIAKGDLTVRFITYILVRAQRAPTGRSCASFGHYNFDFLSLDLLRSGLNQQHYRSSL